MNTFNETNYLADLDFSATGKSAEGKEFTARAQSLFFPGNLLTGIRVGYYQNLKDQVNAELALVDFQGKPASGEVRVTLYKEYYEKSPAQAEKSIRPRRCIHRKDQDPHLPRSGSRPLYPALRHPRRQRPRCFDLGQFLRLGQRLFRPGRPAPDRIRAIDTCTAGKR